MNVLLMTIDEIREIAVKLAKKAKAEIPNVTKEYWGFETFYVTETLVREGELFTMELKCASDEDYKLSHQVTMFADANDKLRKPRHHSRGLRAPCREAPPRCFSWFL